MFLIEIPALGTTAPDWSVTVPESVAPVTWAETGIRIKGLNARAANAIKLAAIFVGRISENMVASQSRNTRAFGYPRDVRFRESQGCQPTYTPSRAKSTTRQTLDREFPISTLSLRKTIRLLPSRVKFQIDIAAIPQR